MTIHLILEGVLEEPVSRKIVLYCGHTVGRIIGPAGFAFVRDHAYKYYSLLKPGSSALILADFKDVKAPCMSEARRQCLPQHISQPNQRFLLNFAVRELESWLMADRQGLATYFGISSRLIPINPEAETNPKRALVDLARRSRKGRIKNAIVPEPKHRGIVGPDYLNAMRRYVDEYWNLENAQENSPSLLRCITRLKELK